MWHYDCMEATLTTRWIPTTGTFAARLALIRNSMQWNLKEASVECGFQINQWANWEAGRMPRNFTKTCDVIAQRTGVDVIWLMIGPEGGKGDYFALSPRPVRRRRSPGKRVDSSAPRPRMDLSHPASK